MAQPRRERGRSRRRGQQHPRRGLCGAAARGERSAEARTQAAASQGREPGGRQAKAAQERGAAGAAQEGRSQAQGLRRARMTAGAATIRNSFGAIDQYIRRHPRGTRRGRACGLVKAFFTFRLSSTALSPLHRPRVPLRIAIHHTLHKVHSPSRDPPQAAIYPVARSPVERAASQNAVCRAESQAQKQNSQLALLHNPLITHTRYSRGRG